ncbi:hypothetical protein, partial [Treponema sp.]|uniref:hypothetical protein n=1 Tax=Treponema sp. TaxID=166 RepID=UPI003EFE370A
LLSPALRLFPNRKSLLCCLFFFPSLKLSNNDFIKTQFLLLKIHKNTALFSKGEIDYTVLKKYCQ